MSQHLRFGIFLPPIHTAGQNPTLALQRDLELIEHLDRYGYDEAWIGEHHSGGHEIIASPEIFIATAAARTQHIRLGTGVVSLPYHNPLWVAERMVLLDHLTHGRVMLGVGPGSLTSDAAMVGLHMGETREILKERFDAMLQLLTTEEPVTLQSRDINLVDARLHLRPYSDPLFDIVVTAIASPSGPSLAGRHGQGLLSVAATMDGGFDALSLHWGVMEESAAKFGSTVDRAKWRLVGIVHCSETREQAYRDVEYGIEEWFHYFKTTAANPQLGQAPVTTAREMIDYVNDNGIGAIGTPDDVAALIDRLWKQSNGGFGAFLSLTHDWANPTATLRSYELIARSVMPEFQSQALPTQAAFERAQSRNEAETAESIKATDDATKRYHELEAQGKA
jgi:limonene 1,2-monooxygenase